MSHSDPASTSGVVARAQQIMARKLTLVHLGVEHVTSWKQSAGASIVFIFVKKNFSSLALVGFNSSTSRAVFDHPLCCLHTRLY